MVTVSMHLPTFLSRAVLILEMFDVRVDVGGLIDVVAVWFLGGGD